MSVILMIINETVFTIRFEHLKLMIDILNDVNHRSHIRLSFGINLVVNECKNAVFMIKQLKSRGLIFNIIYVCHRSALLVL